MIDPGETRYEPREIPLPSTRSSTLPNKLVLLMEKERAAPAKATVKQGG